MVSQPSSRRFPLAFAVAATCGVGAGLMDRGLPFFQHPLPMWAALSIASGGIFGTAIGASGANRQPLFFVFLFLTGGAAALTSGYAQLLGPPSILEVAVLMAVVGYPSSLFFRSVWEKVNASPARSDPSSPWAGVFLYLGATLGLSWVMVPMVPRVAQDPNLPVSFRLLFASAFYAVLMGWQPLVAVYVARWQDRSRGDDWFALPRPTYFLLATIAPLCISGMAIAVAYMLGLSHDLTGNAQTGAADSGWINVSLTVPAMCGGLCLLWIQALTEEVGWRGYFLDGLMRGLGPIVGLMVHGVLWGVWYAPLLIFANGSLSSTGSSYITFLVTCILLGCLLGWLRLASRSVISSALANGTLTVCAGLPFLLEGQDPGIQGMVYGPSGWVPMSIALAFILVTKYRSVLLPEGREVWVFLHDPSTKDGGASKDEPLH